MKPLISLLILLMFVAVMSGQRPFVRTNGTAFAAGEVPYYYIGANYWYGSLLGLEKDRSRGIERLRRELDILKANGVTNLRLMAGAEGSGPLNGVIRVGPPLQPRQGKFEKHALDGLDIILDEMAKRDMRAVIFFSNNWEWSGGWQQYLIWNKVIDAKWLTQKPEWDELRDLIAKFYTCEKCIAAYRKQVTYVLARRNTINGVRYIDDPTVMAWEIANEPRPMRPTVNEQYAKFIVDAAHLIRSKAPKQLVTTGHEGWIGTESVELFERVHADANIDYLTIHIWPKNWGWLKGGDLADSLQNALDKTQSYIADGLRIGKRLGKPLVIEEFGLPRDDRGFDPASTTKLRDKYYSAVFGYVRDGGAAGANFWAFGGTARPIKGQLFWMTGDEYTGDPPMEEQGLNTVFDSDATTLDLIRITAERVAAKNKTTAFRPPLNR